MQDFDDEDEEVETAPRKRARPAAEAATAASAASSGAKEDEKAFTVRVASASVFVVGAAAECTLTLPAQLAKRRRVTVRRWRGSVLVDIREFYEKNGQDLPGKKGESGGGAAPCTQRRR